MNNNHLIYKIYSLEKLNVFLLLRRFQEAPVFQEVLVVL